MKVFLSSILLLFGVIGIGKSQSIQTCTEIPITQSFQSQVPISLPQGASRAVSYKPKYGLYWSNGKTIRVKFIGGNDYLRNRVKYYANWWTQYANLTFDFVNYGHSDLRVSFVQNGSSWSVIGKQALYLGVNEPTMNFGWFDEQTPEFEFQRTILHEFGHALGLLHEHQNPSGGIPWDRAAVYDHYRRTQGWDKKTTYQNVIQKASRNETQFSTYDPKSIMHYPVSPQLTNGRYQIGMNAKLSPTDISFINNIYPGNNWSDSDNTSGSSEESRPPEIITEKPRPTQQRYIISISNNLGQSQIAETVELLLGGEKYVFKLTKDGRRQKTFRFRMTPGEYQYQLSSASIYSTYKKVWNGWRYVRKKVNQTVYGSGAGILEVTGNGELTLYGDYDQNTGRMRVYLGEVNRNGYANAGSATCR